MPKCFSVFSLVEVVWDRHRLASHEHYIFERTKWHDRLQCFPFQRLNSISAPMQRSNARQSPIWCLLAAIGRLWTRLSRRLNCPNCTNFLSLNFELNVKGLVIVGSLLCSYCFFISNKGEFVQQADSLGLDLLLDFFLFPNVT